MVLGNDITSPVAINEFEKAGFEDVFDKSKISLVMDHFTPEQGYQSGSAVQADKNLCQKVRHR